VACFQSIDQPVQEWRIDRWPQNFSQVGDALGEELVERAEVARLRAEGAVAFVLAQKEQHLANLHVKVSRIRAALFDRSNVHRQEDSPEGIGQRSGRRVGGGERAVTLHDLSGDARVLRLMGHDVDQDIGGCRKAPNLGCIGQKLQQRSHAIGGGG
jgi:hypothetical protein